MNNLKHILFWSEFDKSIDTTHETFINKKIILSPIHKLALHSHHRLNNKVILYTYQNINKDDLFPNVEIRNASDIFPSKMAFKVLQSGHSIAHISDCVRLKCASKELGVVLDMDAVLLRKLPSEYGWFASMPAKKTGGVAPKWGKSHPPLTIHDNSWDGKALANFPCNVSVSNAAMFDSLSDKIVKTLMQPPKKGSKAWNFVMWGLKDIMKADETSRVFKPISCCPVPAWLGKGKCYSIESPTRMNGKTQLYGYTFPKIETILKESYIVLHFMESTFSKSNKLEKDFWNTVKSDSLLGQEAKYILGDNWRKTLAYMQWP